MHDNTLIQKLQSEIAYLKNLLQLKAKNKNEELTSQLYSLQQENKKLKSQSMSNQQIETMMQENKRLKLQLQQILQNQEAILSLQ